MSMRREVLCWLVLLLLLQLETSCSADASRKHGKLRGRSSPHSTTVAIKGGFGGGTGKNGDGKFDDEKRRIYTGPNPLHNR